MANRIKGITVEIGGDTTKLSKALDGVNKNIKSTQTQLKDVEKLLKLDPTNTELLAQKQKLLADSVSATREKLDALKDGRHGDGCVEFFSCWSDGGTGCGIIQCKYKCVADRHDHDRKPVYDIKN